jgi:hypothetical protein
VGTYRNGFYVTWAEVNWFMTCFSGSTKRVTHVDAVCIASAFLFLNTQSELWFHSNL